MNWTQWFTPFHSIRGLTGWTWIKCVIFVIPVLMYGIIIVYQHERYEEPVPIEYRVEEGWSKVNEDFYVLSAYWETRKTLKAPFVRFVAIGKRIGEEETIGCKCVLEYKFGIVENVAFEKEVICEHWDRFHSAVFIKCYTNSTRAPFRAGITCPHSEIHWKTVDHLSGSTGKGNLAVCVRPLFNGFRETFHVAEFIAFYDMMGVSKFTFYDLDTSNDTRNFIVALRNLIKIDFLPWALPSAISAWQKGQLAQVQECIYKHMKDFEFVALIDVDEFLVLNSNEKLLDVVRQSSKKTGSIMFRQAFFCASSSSRRRSTGLRTQSEVLRTKLLKPGLRSKVIVRSSAVEIGKIHEAGKYIKGFKRSILSPDAGIMHHHNYRYCKPRFLKGEDTSALKYGPNLTFHPVINFYKQWLGVRSKKRGKN